jgi:hypothetical protein
MMQASAKPQYTTDHDDGFYPALRAVAVSVQANPEHLLAVMMSESGMRANAYNANGNASGLIQFMPATLAGLGWPFGHESFRSLTAASQLPFVQRYFQPHAGLLVSVGAVYTATFLPALLKHAGDPNYILTCKPNPLRDRTVEPFERLGWAYAPNAVFDVNRDLAITVGELEAAVERNCRGARWQEALSRLRGVSIDEAEITKEFVPPQSDLRTTLGIQHALQRLKFSPGALDGIPGPRTTAAVVAFQATNDLKPDGIVGPLTKAKLAARLLSISPPS